MEPYQQQQPGQPQQPQQPQLTDAQRIEQAIASWKRIAADTATVVKTFQAAGFNREESIKLAIAFLTGRQ